MRTRDEAMRDLRCMSFVGKDHSHIITAGCQGVILKLDVEKGRVIEKVGRRVLRRRGRN